MILSVGLFEEGNPTINSDNWDSYRDICHQASRDFMHQLHSLKRLVFNSVILSEKEWISSDRESSLREYQTIGRDRLWAIERRSIARQW